MNEVHTRTTTTTNDDGLRTTCVEIDGPSNVPYSGTVALVNMAGGPVEEGTIPFLGMSVMQKSPERRAARLYLTADEAGCLAQALLREVTRMSNPEIAAALDAGDFVGAAQAFLDA